MVACKAKDELAVEGCRQGKGGLGREAKIKVTKVKLTSDTHVQLEPAGA